MTALFLDHRQRNGGGMKKTTKTTTMTRMENILVFDLVDKTFEKNIRSV